MSKLGTALLIIGVGSILPIWRCAGVNHYMSLWEYFATVAKPDSIYKHIPYSEAVSKARQAYLDRQATKIANTTGNLLD